MTHDPETAERLAAILTPLITEQSCGEWDDKTINEDVQMFLPPLLAALQEARNAALREAANIVRGEIYLKRYRTWVIWPPYDDLPQERPNVSENHGMARHCDQLADAILTLIDTPAPAPPAEPAGDVQRAALADIARQKKTTELETEYDVECADFEGGYDMSIDVARAALAAAPDPQPDAKESKMPLYRKNPVVIEAIQYTGNNLREVLDFAGKHPRWHEWFSSFDAYEEHVRKDRGVFKIVTLEGTMEALPGDWIIRGVKGEHYPCKPDIFTATYKIAPTPQPDADERETLVRFLMNNAQDDYEKFADALLAAGWTRKREEG